MLESIPMEILQSICEYLYWSSVIDRNHDGLVDFSLVSKRSHRAATAVMIQAIKITVSTARQLQLDVNSWEQRQRELPWLEHVRRLDISGSNVTSEHQNDRALESIEQGDAWKPLAEFIRQLPALMEVHFMYLGQFPPCLLAVLHERHANCRLYISAFSFTKFDRNEFELASSPCLHAIRVSSSIASYESEALFRTVSGLAPNLKEVYLEYLAPDACLPAIYEVELKMDAPWPEVLQDNQSDNRRGTLTKLELHNRLDLARWNTVIDMSTLRILKLGNSLDSRELLWLAEHRPFVSLTTLELVINLAWEFTHDEYHPKFSSFIASLPPLSSLRLLANPLELGVLHGILEHHGKSLSQLWLETFGHLSSVVFNASIVEEIQRSCPLLSRLTLLIPRTRGDAQEQIIYKTLGAIPKLQYLSLTLDCSDRTIYASPFDPEGDEDVVVPQDPSFDDFHQTFFPFDPRGSYDTPRNGHVRDALINSAVDENLALAIFQCVASGKTPQDLPLNSLRLRAYGGGYFGFPGENVHLVAQGLPDVIEEIGHSWRISRHPRDDCPGQLVAKDLTSGNPNAQSNYELGPEGLMNGGQWLEDQPGVLGKWMEPVFRRLWPGEGDWRQEWHSFPLVNFEYRK